MPSSENVFPYTWGLVLLHLRASWILDTAEVPQSPPEGASIRLLETTGSMAYSSLCLPWGTRTPAHLLSPRSGYGEPGMAVGAHEAQVI